MPKDLTKLSILYPCPSAPLTAIAPGRLPGRTPTSQIALLIDLKKNYEKFHVYFNDKRFHNHISHQQLALYALGASAETLTAAYETHAKYQRPAHKSPEEISLENFTAHLGDTKYHDAYLNFFVDKVLEKGVSACLEEYIFSPEFNAGSDILRKGGEQQPLMFNRFLAGVVHPFIHAGYGVEFGLPGQVAEGLAMACSHVSTPNGLFPQSLYEPKAVTATGSTVSRLTSMLPSLSISSDNKETAGGHDMTAFAILGRVLADSRLSPAAILTPEMSQEQRLAVGYRTVLDKVGPLLQEYAEQWLPVDGQYTEEALEKKLEQVLWMNVLLYGVGGWGKDKPFNADFFLMHLVTSSLFLPSFLAPKTLSMRSRVILLHTYFSLSLGHYIGRGRPALRIRDFMSSTLTRVTPPGPHPEPNKDAIPQNNKDVALTPNVWTSLVQTTLAHPDDHLPKLQRALLHYANLWGDSPRGYWERTEGLEGAEELDGTLFVRVALLTAQRLGWMREGEEEGSWDFEGFF